MAPPKPDVPAAGVTATRPAIAPDAPPKSDALPATTRSASIQASMPAAGATNVFIIAIAAPPVASRFEPALKPNQPETQPLAREEHADQPRDAGVDVDNCTPGKIERAHAENQPVARPNHVRDGDIDDRQPDHGE